MKRSWPTAFSLVLIAVFVISFVPQARPAYASTSGVVISQVYGGGGNTGATLTNDFIELFNAGSAPVALKGWSVQYASSTGSSWSVTYLTNFTLQPSQYYLVQEAKGSGGTMPLPVPDAIGTITMSATSGKVAIVRGTTALTGTCPTVGVEDFVGFGNTLGNTANCSETAPTATLSNKTAAIRSNGGATDTDNNAADFTTGAPNPHNSDYPGPMGAGSATPNVLLRLGDPVTLTVAVTPGALQSDGFSVTCDLTGIGGSATQQFFDDGTNGDALATDNTFTFSTAIAAAQDNRALCTVSDAQGKHGRAVIDLNLLLTLGVVNGPVGDTDNGTAHTSPFAGRSVMVQGVIYEKTLQAGGSTAYGFFIQNTATTADGDPNSSDGMFVYNGSYSTLLKLGASGTYTPTVGDEVILNGVVSEYYYMTELTSARLVGAVVRSGVIINDEVPAAIAAPMPNLADANRYWERLQGMRVQVPSNSVVLGGRNVFSPADAEIWVARADSTIGLRTTEYTNRAFRDAHPLDDNYDPNIWDGNGYRILMGSLGIKASAAAAGDPNAAQVLIDPARTFDTVTNAPSGGLNYTFSKYRIEITEQPDFSLGPDPAQNNPSQVPALSNDYTIVDYNLENLYDYRDNPFSGCDFASDSGCPKVAPFLAAISSPFDYVPASDAAYQARLTDIATQIINDLHSPDILMVQEVENQDICSVGGTSLVCGTIDNADGKPDVLQDLALKIAQLGGPAYDAAYDPNSSDLRGILPAFLFRTDRVELVSPAGDPVLGAAPAIPGYTSVPYDSDISNPKTLNAPYTGTGACETSWVFPRAPDVGLFRIHAATPGSTDYRDVYVINNHFKSGPDTCVAHRTEQARYNAALVAFIESSVPGARVVVGGDLNVYPRPDDIAFNATDQLGSLYDPALGLKNLWEVLLGQAPEAAYSYVYLGMAQTLDQMFVNSPMLADLGQFRIAHINSDFPADYPGDVARGTSDHDPNVATFGMFAGFFQPVDNLPELNIAKAGSAVPVRFGLGGDEGLNVFAAGYPKSQVIACPSAPLTDGIEQTVPAGNSSLQYDPLTQTYTYVWKTDKAYAGSCRQLTVQFIDGTLYQANFQFTK